MKRQSILLFEMAIICFAFSNVWADMVFNDGGPHTINSVVRDNVMVYNSSLDKPTTANLVTGGTITYNLFVYDSSKANIFDGVINYQLFAFESSQVSVSGGIIGDTLFAHENSLINISNGSIYNYLDITHNSQANISGGTIGNIYARQYSQVDISGGTIQGNFTSDYFSSANITGGTIGGSICVRDQSQLTIYGSGFNYPYGTITGSGTLTGMLASGELINNDFSTIGNARIVLTPVPSAVILGSLGLTFSGWLLRRRRML